MEGRGEKEARGVPAVGSGEGGPNNPVVVSLGGFRLRRWWALLVGFLGKSLVGSPSWMSRPGGG